MQLPDFKYPIVKELYKYDFTIDRKILRGIVDLGNKVIPDLEMVLDDIIKHDADYSTQESFNWHTPTHALHLLGELKAEKSLPKILQMFSQPEDFLEFWFSDGLNEEMWEVIYKCGQNSLDQLEKFISNHSNREFARTAVSNGLTQIALHHTEKQKEIIKIYKRVIKATIPQVKYVGKSRGGLLGVGRKPDAAKDMMGWLVSDLMDLGNPKLKDYLADLFNKGVVEETIVSRKELDKVQWGGEKKEIKSIFNRYDELERVYNRSEQLEIEPVVSIKSETVGRNEPCSAVAVRNIKSVVI